MSSVRSPRSRFSLRSLLVLFVVLGCVMLVVAERAGLAPALAQPVVLLLEWSMILAGVALLLGVLNVLWVHVRRVQRGQAGWQASLLLVVTAVAVAAAGLANRAGERSPLVEWAYDALIEPGASTLFALLAVFLLAVIFHQVRVGRPGGAWVLSGLLVMLVAQTPAARALLSPDVEQGLQWFVDAPVTATLRGTILGVGLALLVVGVRLMLRRRL